MKKDYLPKNKGTTPDEKRAIRREWINFVLQSGRYTLSEIKKAVRFYELR